MNKWNCQVRSHRPQHNERLLSSGSGHSLSDQILVDTINFLSGSEKSPYLMIVRVRYRPKVSLIQSSNLSNLGLGSSSSSFSNFLSARYNTRAT